MRSDILTFTVEEWNSKSWCDIEEIMKKRIPVLITKVDVMEDDVIKMSKSKIDKREINLKFLVCFLIYF